MRKKDIVYIIALITLLIASIASFVYAWFSLVEKTQPIIIYSGTIELEAKLYEKGNTSTEVTTIEHTKVVPGDTFEYQIDVTNNGTLEGSLSILFNLNSASAYLKDYIVIKIKDSNNVVLFNYDLTNSPPEFEWVLNLLGSESKTFYFEIEILGDLELQHITAANYIKIDSIEIELIQNI